MSNMVDLLSLLCLDAKSSQSTFNNQHRTILITKDFTSPGDFVFNSLLQHFARKEPQASILLITLNQEWSHYSASAAKCGINLRRKQNNGNIDVISVSSKLFDAIRTDKEWKLCDFILDSVKSFIEAWVNRNSNSTTQLERTDPIIVMLDDLSILFDLGSAPDEIYRLFTNIDSALKEASANLNASKLNYFVTQTMVPLTSSKNNFQNRSNDDLSYLVNNLENLSDLIISLRPLDTGYSTRVDGTIKIVDNRAPTNSQPPTSSHTKLLPPAFTLNSTAKNDVGTKKAFFFKLGDRRVRLTSSALIF